MEKFKKFYSLFSIQFAVILILVVSRLIPHPPNFTPIISVAILCSFFFNSWIKGLFIVVISMLISDLVIGFHSNMFFVYMSLIAISIYSKFFFQNFKIKNVFIHCFLSSLIFFIISNFGVWVLGNLYSKDIQGLYECYFMAIPFFSNTLLSTIFFTYAYFFCNKSLLEKYQK